jgi:hypothetical protein
VKPNEHSGFALELARYLNHLRGSMSGREFARLAASGSHDHWAQILAGNKVMTTNDIKVAAEVVGRDPYTFVAEARAFAHANVTPIRNVGVLDEDGRVLTPEQERALRESDPAIAAKRGRNEADTTHTEG